MVIGSLVDDSHHTSQVGTQLYMSPEQVIFVTSLRNSEISVCICFKFAFRILKRALALQLDVGDWDELSSVNVKIPPQTYLLH